MTWGMLPMAYRVPPLLDFPLFTLYGANFPAYRGFMLLVSAGMLLAIWLLLKKTRIGLIIQAALTHPRWRARLAITCRWCSPSCSPAAACWPGSRA